MLKVKGNRIIDDSGRIILLRGVNRAGLEWDSRDTEIIRSVCMAFDDWNANIIRLPISQDRWFGYAAEQNVFGELKPSTAQTYREICDAVIEEAKKRDKFILFELHWSNLGEWGKNIGQHNMPDGNSVVFWKNAAMRYKNHPNVIFGLYNEPHDVDWDVWKKGGKYLEGALDGGKICRAVGMQTLCDTVRSVGAENIIVAGGLDWGCDLCGINGGYSLDDENVVYDSHVYPWKPLDWDDYVTIIADRYPIMIGEFGHYGDDAKPIEGKQGLLAAEWVPRILVWIAKNGYHCCAWDFHPGAGPCLINDFSGEPTPYFGSYVKEFLAKE